MNKKNDLLLPHLKDHIALSSISLREAFKRIEQIKGAIYKRVLFIVDDDYICIGSLTDGDLRRAIINKKSTDSLVQEVMNTSFKSVRSKEELFEKRNLFKSKLFNLIPLLNNEGQVIEIFDLNELRSVLPVDAFILAGGEGKRLRPLTENTPKPLLHVGDKPILHHNIERLSRFGISNIQISLNYLGQQIEDYFSHEDFTKVNIGFVYENSPLGTLGSITLAQRFNHEFVLVMNSDLLTDIDLEDFLNECISNNADMSIATIPYEVSIPYAVLNIVDDKVDSLAEKPKYTYYSNAGIYLIKTSLLNQIPKNKKYDATDLIESIIGNGHKVTSYPIRSYWLDIGKMGDFEKAQEDIKHINL